MIKTLDKKRLQVLSEQQARNEMIDKVNEMIEIVNMIDRNQKDAMDMMRFKRT